MWDLKHIRQLRERLPLLILRATIAGIISGMVGWFSRQLFRDWGILDPYAASFGRWLKMNVTPETLWNGAGLIVFLGLWAVSLFFMARHNKRAPAEQSANIFTAAAPLSSHERSQWQQEWHDQRDVRREFWRLLNTAYKNWTGNPTDRSIQDLVEASQFPPELPLDDGRQFPNWVWNVWDKQDREPLKTLRNFTSQIYPGVTPAETIKTQLMGGGNEFDRFDDLRRELSKLWDYWGRQEPLEEIIREQNADNIIRSSAPEIKLLTFLEIARARWAQTGASGKAGLFSLGRRNAETE